MPKKIVLTIFELKTLTYYPSHAILYIKLVTANRFQKYNKAMEGNKVSNNKIA